MPQLDRRRLSAGAAILAAALATASLCSDAAYAQDASVKIANFTFAPKRLTVKIGTTVTWSNDDDIPHTIASAAGLFKSMALDTDDSFSFTFTKPGSYEYFCSLHPRMTGTIVVGPK